MPEDLKRYLDNYRSWDYWKSQAVTSALRSWSYWYYVRTWQNYNKSPPQAFSMAPPSTPPIPAPKPSSAVMEEVSKLMREIKEPNPQGIDVKSAGGATNEKTIYRELMKRGALKKGRKWVLPVAVGLSVLAAIIAGLIINPAITIIIIAIAVFILIRRSAY